MRRRAFIAMLDRALPPGVASGDRYNPQMMKLIDR